jgi:hypothetical protein
VAAASGRQRHDCGEGMTKDRSDFAVMNRMIDHIRLLIAVDDEQIPVKKKLDVQATLKEFQALLAIPEERQERGRIRGYYEVLCRELGDYGDIDALLKSLRNYISYI